MRNKFPLAGRLMFAIGLLMATLPQFLKSYIYIPDFLVGFIVGVGIALEITAFIRLKRAKDSGQVS